MCSRKWLIVALVAWGLTSACSQYNTNLTVQTSSSVVSYISPSAVTAGGPGFTITVNGGGYVTGAIILWNGTALTTTLVSSKQVTAPVPASLIAATGSVQVAVQIPGSASSPTSNIYNTTTTEVSNIVYLTINPAAAAAPAVTSLSASTTSQASSPYCGAAGLTLTVNGTNFTSDAVVKWNGSARTTTFVSATQLTADILPADTAFPGTAVVSVSNSAGASNALSFTMSTPVAALAAPSIASLSQTDVAVGSPAITLTVTGSNILPCSVVQWVNGSNVTSSLATTYISPTQLSAIVPATDFTALDTAQIVVFTLAPGGGTSGGISFHVLPPAITSLSSSTTSSSSTPSCTTSGFVLTVNGTNFVNGSVVDWNGSGRSTTFVSSTQLTALISSTDIISAGSANITVSNFGVSSSAVPFTVSNASSALPLPAITSVSPASATAGTSAFILTVTGSNFVPCSAVEWNSSVRATTYVSATSLQASIPASDITTVGSAQITVFNPTSSGGGGASNAISLPIVPPTITSLSSSTTALPSTPYCSPTGLTLTVNGTDFASGVVVNWNGSPRPTTFVTSTQITAAISATDTAFPGTVTITVSSSTATSNSLTFTMTDPTSPLPTPVISSLSPANVTAGAPAFLLTVNGTNLLPCTVIQWNASNRTSTFIGTTGVTAAISAADVSTQGTAQVTAFTLTAGGGGGTSNQSAFTILSSSTPAAQSGPVAAASGSTAETTAGSLPLPVTSADGRYAVFVLASTDGITETPGSTENIFVRDTCTGAPAGCTPSTALESIGFNSNPADGNSISPSISADGRYVTFVSSATNLVVSDTNAASDVFVRDTCAGAASGCTPATQRASVASDGTQANGESTSASISSDGRYVTFRSSATNLDPAVYVNSTGLFLRDTCAGAASGCTPSTQYLNLQK